MRWVQHCTAWEAENPDCFLGLCIQKERWEAHSNWENNSGEIIFRGQRVSEETAERGRDDEMLSAAGEPRRDQLKLLGSQLSLSLTDFSHLHPSRSRKRSSGWGTWVRAHYNCVHIVHLWIWRVGGGLNYGDGHEIGLKTYLNIYRKDSFPKITLVVMSKFTVYIHAILIILSINFTWHWIYYLKKAANYSGPGTKLSRDSSGVPGPGH